MSKPHGPHPLPPCPHQSTLSQEEQRGDELWYVVLCLECSTKVQEGCLGKVPGSEDKGS